MIDKVGDNDLMISFSGGRTSAYMTLEVLKLRPDAKVVFANTGFEHPKTYEFIEKFVQEFGVDLVCLELVVGGGRRGGTGYKVVKFSEMRKNGEPFIEMVQRFGIPNKGYPHCTRELKIQPIHAWAKDNLKKGYWTAIGIRADEIDRMDSKKDDKHFCYPLVNLGVMKHNIDKFWSEQSFNLEIKQHLGNCVTCWKKSDRRLKAVLDDMPEAFDLFDRIEKQYSLVREYAGHQYFYRGKRNTKMLLDDLTAQSDLGDMTEGCQESCEVF